MSPNRKKLGMKSKKKRIKGEWNKKDIPSFDIIIGKGAASWLNAKLLKQYHHDLTRAGFLMALQFAEVDTP